MSLLLLFQGAGDGSNTINVTGFTTTTAFGTHSVELTLGMVGFSPSTTFGTASAEPTIAPAGFASSTAFGAAQLEPTIAPAGFSPSTAFGAPTISGEAGTIAPVGFVTTTAFGTPVVVGVALEVETNPGGSVWERRKREAQRVRAQILREDDELFAVVTALIQTGVMDEWVLSQAA